VLFCLQKHSDTQNLDSSRARKAFEDAEDSLKFTKNENKNAVEDLARLFDVDGYGSQGEWKKLEDTCLEKDGGE
jgi:protein kinase C substrate 80K-H